MAVRFLVTPEDQALFAERKRELNQAVESALAGLAKGSRLVEEREKELATLRKSLDAAENARLTAQNVFDMDDGKEPPVLDAKRTALLAAEAQVAAVRVDFDRTERRLSVAVTDRERCQRIVHERVMQLAEFELSPTEKVKPFADAFEQMTEGVRLIMAAQLSIQQGRARLRAVGRDWNAAAKALGLSEETGFDETKSGVVGIRDVVDSVRQHLIDCKDNEPVAVAMGNREWIDQLGRLAQGLIG